MNSCAECENANLEPIRVSVKKGEDSLAALAPPVYCPPFGAVDSFKTMAPTGTLYLVPTPIGNLGDITLRAVEILKAVSVVACEDTRLSGRLLQHLGISKPLLSYHDVNERRRAEQLLQVLQSGQDVAVITDGGSPGISDPAYRIVRLAVEHSVPIIPLPGPTAIIPALTASGLPTDRFFFEGFLPQKSTARKRRLEALRSYPHSLVFYESPFRVGKALADMAEVLGDRPACVAREITKKFEEWLRGTLPQLAEQVATRNLKGEIVIVVAGNADKHEPQVEDVTDDD